jgi:hypothetical protein
MSRVGETFEVTYFGAPVIAIETSKRSLQGLWQHKQIKVVTRQALVLMVEGFYVFKEESHENSKTYSW